MKDILRSTTKFPQALRVLVMCCIVLLAPLRAQAQEARVDGAAALRAILAEGHRGTIVLAPGAYGDLEISGAFPAPLIFRSESLHDARFASIKLTNAANLAFDGIRLEDSFRVERSQNISISNCDVDSMLYFREVSRVRVSHCDVSDGQYGILLNTVADFRITNNHIHGVGEDLMRITGNSFDGLVEGNIIADTKARKPLHPDIIQFFHSEGQAPHRITIRRNLLNDPGVKGTVPAQGIFVSDPGRGEQNRGYRDILIEENLINTAATNTVFVNSGRSSVTIRNNTLMSRNGGGGNIRIIGKSFGDGGPRIEGNAFKALVDKDRLVRLGPNLVYDGTGEARLFSGSGARWQDYLPILGSALDRSGMGAVGFLADLQASQKPGYDGPPLLGPSWAQ
jgi:hypothetical protein